MAADDIAWSSYLPQNDCGSIIFKKLYLYGWQMCKTAGLELNVDPTQDKEGTKLVVRRLYRPEDVSTNEGYRAGFYDVFASIDEATLRPEDIVGRVEVALPGSSLGKYLHAWHCWIHEHKWPPLTAYQQSTIGNKVSCPENVNSHEARFVSVDSGGLFGMLDMPAGTQCVANSLTVCLC